MHNFRGRVRSKESDASGTASFIAGRVYWHIEARLDAKGVDLYAKEKCQVNLSG